MTYTYTLRSGEEWSSTHLPTVAPWAPATELKTCSKCSNDPSDEMYEYSGNGRAFCKRCYIHYTTDSDVLLQLPVSSAQPWFTEQAWRGGWRIARGPQIASMMAQAAATGRLISSTALYLELAEVDSTETDAPEFHEWMVCGCAPLIVSVSGWKRWYFSFMHKTHRFIVALPCVVCGRGGSLIDRGCGVFHSACWAWFRLDGAMEAEGVVTHPCGHSTGPRVIAAPLTCLDCGDTLTDSGCALCEECDRAAPRCLIHQILHRNREQYSHNAGVVEAKIDAGFNMFAALADFYILTDLHERAPALVEAEYTRRVQEIADELARYTIMATGGEARHWTSRDARDAICVRDIKDEDVVDPAQRYCLVCCKTECNNSEHKPHQMMVLHYSGLNRHRGEVGDHRAHCMRISGSITKLTIDGVRQELGNSRALWEPFGLITVPEKERSSMWAAYYHAFREHGLPVLDTCVKHFETGSWVRDMGGPKWAMAARLVRDYANGTINPPVFVDSIFGVQHNGGSLFNKVYALQLNHTNLNELLDVRRSMQSSLVLLPWASPATRWQWLAVAFELQDPELLLGVQLWRAAFETGRVTPETFAKQLYYYRRTEAKSGDWAREARRFKLRQAHRPVWRKTIRIKKITTAAAVAQLSATAGVLPKGQCPTCCIPRTGLIEHVCPEYTQQQLVGVTA